MSAVMERKQATPVEIVRQDLAGDTFRQQLKMVLPDHVSIEKFCRVAITAMQSNYLLAECDRRSFLKACLEAATDGLLPDGREGAIVPFRNKRRNIVEAQWQPMVWGLVKLVRQSGELLDIGAYIVRDTDKFEQWVDETGPHFKHTPNYLDQGKALAVYAYARTKDGGCYIEVMSWAEIEKFKALSKATSEDTPWKTWPEEMAKVRPIKRLCKRLPMSTDAIAAMERDDARERAREGVTIDPIAAMNQQITGTGTAAPALENDSSPALDQDMPSDAAAVTVESSEQTQPAADGAPPPLTHAAVAGALEKATTIDALDDAATGIERVVVFEQRKELAAIYKARRAELEGKQ